MPIKKTLDTSEYKDSRVDVVLATFGSLFFHILVFLLFLFWVSLTGYALVKQEEAPEEKYITLSREYFQREVEDPAPPKPEERKKFAEVNPSIAEAEVTNAKLIGERSVRAASETVLDNGDPTLPTQITRFERDQELPNTFDSDFIDGEIELPPSPESTKSSEHVEVVTLQSEMIEETVEEGNNVEESLPEPTTQEEEKLAETETQVEVPEQEKQDELKEAEKVVEDEKLAESETIGEKKNEVGLPKKRVETSEATAGFQTEQKKTRIIGSLSRDGQSSLEVQKSALGQYYSTVSKIIERKWQQNCLKYREHIQPGVISMQFFVDGAGKVTNPKPHDVVSTSTIQVGFTMKAIRSSELPPMSAEAKKELDGEKLELIYNFYF